MCNLLLIAMLHNMLSTADSNIRKCAVDSNFIWFVAHIFKWANPSFKIEKLLLSTLGISKIRNIWIHLKCFATTSE